MKEIGHRIATCSDVETSLALGVTWWEVVRPQGGTSLLEPAQELRVWVDILDRMAELVEDGAAEASSGSQRALLASQFRLCTGGVRDSLQRLAGRCPPPLLAHATEVFADLLRVALSQSDPSSWLSPVPVSALLHHLVALARALSPAMLPREQARSVEAVGSCLALAGWATANELPADIDVDLCVEVLEELDRAVAAVPSAFARDGPAPLLNALRGCAAAAAVSDGDGSEPPSVLQRLPRRLLGLLVRPGVVDAGLSSLDTPALAEALLLASEASSHTAVTSSIGEAINRDLALRAGSVASALASNGAELTPRAAGELRALVACLRALTVTGAATSGLANAVADALLQGAAIKPAPGAAPLGLQELATGAWCAARSPGFSPGAGRALVQLVAERIERREFPEVEAEARGADGALAQALNAAAVSGISSQELAAASSALLLRRALLVADAQEAGLSAGGLGEAELAVAWTTCLLRVGAAHAIGGEPYAGPSMQEAVRLDAMAVDAVLDVPAGAMAAGQTPPPGSELGRRYWPRLNRVRCFALALMPNDEERKAVRGDRFSGVVAQAASRGLSSRNCDLTDTIAKEAVQIAGQGHVQRNVVTRDGLRTSLLVGLPCGEAEADWPPSCFDPALQTVADGAAPALSTTAAARRPVLLQVVPEAACDGDKPRFEQLADRWLGQRLYPTASAALITESEWLKCRTVEERRGLLRERLGIDA